MCGLWTCLAAMLLCTVSATNALDFGSNKQPLDIKTFHSLSRVGAPLVSPNQQLALFTTSYYNEETNKNAAYISCLNITSGNITQLTDNSPGVIASNPLWFDDQTIGYLQKGALYRQPLNQSEPIIVFQPPVPISNVAFRKEQNLLTFVASVHPNCSLEESAIKRIQVAKKSDTAMVFDNLWARHWNEWMTMEKPTVFSAQLQQDKGRNWSLSRMTNYAELLPSSTDLLTRWAVDDYTVSPSGEHLAFITRPPSENMTWSTNVDVYLTTTSNPRPRLLTGRVSGAASAPVFSWDGTKLAWLQMETPGYESDINRIYVYTLSTRETIAIAYDWDLSPHAISWARDNKSLLAVVSKQGRNIVVRIGLDGKRQELTSTGSTTAIRAVNNQTALTVYSQTDTAPDLHMLDLQRLSTKQLTQANRKTLENVHLSKAEDFWFTGARGDRVHGWILRPYNFDRRQKYPLALMIHGGPQQASTQGFSFSQWNPNMYANAGFVTVQINFHGSQGYGQNFTNSIRHKWGDYPYDDLMRGIDYVTSRLRFVDPQRMVALGGSFGGYMVNWINGHTQRFRALVSHDGKFSTISGFYGTDELWFPEWDLGKPWDPSGRAILEENNPERFASSFKTPTLFIQGEHDFRIPATESLGAWAMLRHRGIPSRLVYFPDEDHWINHGGNSMRWYTEVLDWITKWTNTTAPYKIR
ncbi:dipeptidylpeptidase [Coemansia brasiliensis]|uniref:Dipeptidyl-peptidase V n=1 Tax=Coemansia brasiliensis TaxID=2650707 RepID=A0A9W8IAJ4_9FUNG|nr:dipeptidylpeptidase [Coemansia brasiliensis]